MRIRSAVIVVCMTIFLICTLASLGTVVVANREQCHAYNNLRGAIVTILKRSEKDLPMNKYYIAHPAELAQAQAESGGDVAAIQDVTC